MCLLGKSYLLFTLASDVMGSGERYISATELIHIVGATRIPLFLSSMIYSLALVYCLASYAAAEWPQYGFSYGGLGSLDVALVAGAILLWSLVLPKNIDRPSSLFLVVVYLFLCIPGVVLMVGLDREPDDIYYPLLIVLAIGFAFSCVMARSFSWKGVGRADSRYFLDFLLVVWVIGFVFLIVSYGSVMSFSGLEEIYIQRERGAARSLIDGYIQAYFGYVISPALLVFGLFYRRYLLIFAGVSGALTLYMITAEKAGFIYPVFIVVLFSALKSRLRLASSVSFMAILFSVVLFLAIFLNAEYSAASFVAWYLGIRSLLFPGAFIAYYADFFGKYGYTYFGHISGISKLGGAPDIFLSDTRWPSLGLLVGEDYLGVPTLNANASFIASDGVASFGYFGVVAAFILFTLFLIVLDWVSRGVNPVLALPILLPLALTLTNGSLFTSMTSFGGLFWIVCFCMAFSVRKDA